MYSVHGEPLRSPLTLAKALRLSKVKGEERGNLGIYKGEPAAISTCGSLYAALGLRNFQGQGIGMAVSSFF